LKTGLDGYNNLAVKYMYKDDKCRHLELGLGPQLQAVRVSEHPAQQTYICTQHYYTCQNPIKSRGQEK